MHTQIAYPEGLKWIILPCIAAQCPGLFDHIFFIFFAVITLKWMHMDYPGNCFFVKTLTFPQKHVTVLIVHHPLFASEFISAIQ